MSIKRKDFNIDVGTGIIKIFERSDIEKYRIFSEFIDNSFQSWLDHKDLLVNKLHVNRCLIDIKWTNDEIIIKDNAFGMDEEAFGRAIRLNAPSKKYSKGSLSKYGMGLKYAAANLGTKIVVESSAYGSKLKYKGLIDVDDWIKNNPKTMPVEIDDSERTDSHYTVLKVTDLKLAFSEKQMRDVIKKLGIMYYRFLDKKQLQITMNQNKISYSDPDLYADSNGSEVYESIDRSFMFNGKKYNYTGWIGILKEGSVSDAGLRLMLNGRGIQLTYRPYAVFGKPNDFRYQRVVGEIEFIGDSWDVKVNKDGMVWVSNGLETRFLEDLLKINKVQSLLKLSKTIRKREKPVRKISLSTFNANVTGIESSGYKIGTKVCFTVFPYPGHRIKTVKIDSTDLSSSSGDNRYSFVVDPEMPDTIKVKVICEEEKTANVIPEKTLSGNQSGKVVVKVENNVRVLSRKEKIQQMLSGLSRVKMGGEEVNQKPHLYKDGIIVKLQNTSFSFDIVEDYNKNNEEWFNFKEKGSPYENSYEIDINHGAGFFDGVMLQEEFKNSIVCLAISMALSCLLSAHNGVNHATSKKLINRLNDTIFRSTK